MKVKVQNQESLQFDVDGLLTFDVAFGGNYYGVVLSKNFVSEGYAITKLKESEVPKDESFTDLDKNKFGLVWRFFYTTLPTAVVAYETGGESRSFYKIKRMGENLIFRMNDDSFFDANQNKVMERTKFNNFK